MRSFERILLGVVASCALITDNDVFAQINELRPSVAPVAPSSYQFIKYGEIPVSEYTGIPEVNIPIYTIKDGDIEFPLTLSYHAGGIRVSEEATWVGLAWNFDVGSVTQIVNDRDDLANFDKTLIDYYAYGVPYRSDFIYRHPYPFIAQNPPNFGVSEGITKASPIHTFIVYTNLSAPIDGVYHEELRELFNMQGGSADVVDSEPDVFKASFDGHYLEFVMEFKGPQGPQGPASFKILNKQNYIVCKESDNDGNAIWKITTPEGMQYLFEQIDEIKHEFSQSVVDVANTSQSSRPDLVSRVWHVTRLTSPNNRTLKFKWERTQAVRDLLTYSNKDIYSDYTGDFLSPNCQINGVFRGIDGQSNGLYPHADLTVHGYSFSRTKPFSKSYLTSIEFSLGVVTFRKSSRMDKIEDLRLDSIMVKNSSRLVKKFSFTYDYFVATENGNSIAQNLLGAYTASEITHRLKLQSFKEEGVPAHRFYYDETPLPRKTSFAIDYWGFYNGKTSNTSYVPNPTHLNISLPDNGNDRRADLTSSRACTLTELVYPTSGKTIFEYQLNNFTYANPLMPITEGMGLRIRSITSTTQSGSQTKTRYSYEGGRAMNEVAFHGRYGMNTLDWTLGEQNTAFIEWAAEFSFMIDYLSGNNFYSSSLLGSGNFIGYDKVTKENLDRNGIPLGKIVSTYSNHPDIGIHDEILDVSLPSRKDHRYPENGLPMLKEVYDASNVLVQSTINHYSFKVSDPYYGVRISPDGFLAIKAYILSECTDYSYPRHLAGYYPLYSMESLLDWVQVEEYSNGTTMASRVDYTYNDTNLLLTTTKSNSKEEKIVTTNFYPTEANPELISRNIIGNPIYIRVEKAGGVRLSGIAHGFSVHHGLVQKRNITESFGTEMPIERVVFDDYDEHGNLLKYYLADKVVHALVWGYNKSLVTAEVINANPDQIAYSGFEDSDDGGGWTYSHDVTTGGKTGYFAFAGSAISKSQLPLGDYVVTFWAKKESTQNGAISGSLSESIQTEDWQFYSYKLKAVTGVTLNVTSAIIDELRLYPEGAQMKTYEHDPLIGLTSQTDADGKVTTFFKYDSTGKLISVHDANGDIVKAFEYGFKLN